MSEASKEFMLGALRVASLRAEMWKSELNRIGVALKADMITPELAVMWLKEMGGLDWLDATTVGLVTGDDAGKK
jgi:hypothetical protein